MAILHDIRRPVITNGGARDKVQHPRLHRQTEYIPVDKLSVTWVRAQRPFDPAWARLIADNFDPELFDDVVVTLPDARGVHHVAEGQHRTGAVELLWGDQELVPCRIVNVRDPQSAAQIWERINTSRKPPKKIDLFNVRVEAGDPTNVEVADILDRLDLRVGNKSKGQIAAVQALLAVHRLGPTVLERTLNTIKATYDLHQDAYSAPMLRGFGTFVFEHGNRAHMRRLAENVHKTHPTPASLIAAARTDLAARSVSEGVLSNLILIYNRGLKRGVPRLERI